MEEGSAGVNPNFIKRYLRLEIEETGILSVKNEKYCRYYGYLIIWGNSRKEFRRCAVTITDTLAQPFAEVRQDAEELRDVKILAAELATADAKHISVQVSIEGDKAKELGPKLNSLIAEMITMLANDQEPSLVSVPQELTTTVAAKRLGISRPTLMKLIREGKIPAHKVRSHVRLLTADVDAFRQKQLQKQLDAFNKLRDFEHEMGL